VSGVGDRLECVTGAIGAVTQHIHRLAFGQGRVRLEEPNPCRAVGGLDAGGLGQLGRGHDPGLGFHRDGSPTGIDVTKVVRTGIPPHINTGMARKVAGVGQVGAGLVNPPAEIFPAALKALARAAPSLPAA